MHIQSDGSEHRFEFYLGEDADRFLWERIERDVRRFKQVTSSEVSMRSGYLRVTADLGQLSGRTLKTACAMLDSRIRQHIDHVKKNADSAVFITVR